MAFRELDREERTAMNRAFDRWGVYGFFADKSILVAEENGKRKICLISLGLGPVVLRLSPLHAGLVIGELKKTFTPTFAGADLFARHATKNRYYVTVNESAEQLVLYGRDLMGESIVSASETLEENELVVMLNRNQEAIAVGRTRFSGVSLKQEGKITITTISDAGLYLREEG